MTVSARVRDAAERVLSGDDSVQAANWLESAILDDHLGDEHFDDLLEGLALYAPGQGFPYLGAAELRTLIRKSLKSTDADQPSGRDVE